jgi:uncharacterized protein YdiU (UPF0061 family)
VPAPRLLKLNHALATELGLDPDALQGPDAAALFAGNACPRAPQPLAQAYAGHQFGGFSPQLGDGRALLLGEVIDRRGRRRDIAFKGSGRTPFSRGGDGKAALGPMLREVLIGEAMHALGIPPRARWPWRPPASRCYRERPLPGAVLTRVAASHLRVGTFQYFAARGEHDKLRQLADLRDRAPRPRPGRHAGPYLALLRAVAQRQAALVAQWMNVGFIHGVMNTDNMTISGETIDYGPCAFMEAYDPARCSAASTTAAAMPTATSRCIARWNLARLAETLLPLMADDPDTAVQRATEVIDAFPGWYAERCCRASAPSWAWPRRSPTTRDLVADWLALLHTQAVDFTLAWRLLADAAEGAAALAGTLATACCGRGPGSGGPRRRHAAGQPAGHCAQPPGRRSAGRRRRPRRPGAVRTAAGRGAAAVRRPSRLRALCRARAARADGALPDLLRHLNRSIRG